MERNTPANRPLATFALFAYNQERFVREAIRGALSQTYSPLQIVISDDCSQDATFEAIREEVAGYDGPHQVVLNRNERNLGLSGHINRVIELSEGELIVVAAADDVSVPTRTEELVRVWSEEDIYCLYTDHILIDEEGVEERGAIREARMKYGQEPAKSWEEMVRLGRTGVNGSAVAWHRALFDVFGPLPDKVMTEDVPLPFRAALLGEVAYVSKPLVRYRRHDANASVLIFQESKGESLAQFARREAAMARMFGNHYESWLRDMDHFSSSHPKMKEDLSRAMKTTRSRMDFFRFKESAAETGIKDRLRRFPGVARSVRALGLKQVMKLCLLAASPAAYYRVQRSSKKPPGDLLANTSSEVDPLRVMGPE